MTPKRPGRGGSASEEWVFGLHSVEAALDSERSISVLYRARDASDRRLTPLVKAAQARGVPVVRVPKNRLDQLASGGNHQGIAVSVSPVPLRTPAQWLRESADLAGSRLVLVLDGVTDEGNAGALVRSAAALGADAVLLAGKGGVRPGPGLARTASGALERVPIVVAPTLGAALDALEQARFGLFAAVVEGGMPPGPEDRAGDRALILGAEDRGVRDSIRQRIHRHLTIPTRDRMPALNVAAAGAILLAQLGNPGTGLDSPSGLGRS